MRRTQLIGVSVVAAGAALALNMSVSSARPPGAAAGGLDCFADLMRGTSDAIVCDFPLQPNAAERADLEKQSRGYLKNASCTVSVRIPRSAVLAAVNTPDYVFKTNPQPVRCMITVHWREKSGPETLPISATFAPHVTIRGGKAIDTMPGLADITGVPRPLSWPVETWVNSGIGIRSNMLQIINAWLDHMRHRPASTRAVARTNRPAP